MKAVDVRDLEFSYSNNKIIKDTSFSIEIGDFAAIIGSNGSGKSTLMKLILGELEADHGSIKIMDKQVEKDMAFPKLRYVAQLGLGSNYSFPASCYELVSTGIYKGFGRKLSGEDKRKIDQAFDLVGMSEYKKTNIGKLSGGQRQRVLLARALVSQPDILMLDEPTAGIDKETSQSFYELLDELNSKENLTIINITHDLEKIYKFTNRVFSLCDGKIHELTREEVEKEVQGKHVHLGQ